MTHDELIAEIETGPLAAELAPFWATVFEVHPDQSRRPPRDLAEASSWRVKRERAGRLHPDAAFEIHRRLTENAWGLTPEGTLTIVPSRAEVLGWVGLTRKAVQHAKASTLTRGRPA